MELYRGRPGLCRNKPLLYLPFGGEKKDSQKSVSLCQVYEIHCLQVCSENTCYPVTGYFSKSDNAYLTLTSAKVLCGLIHRCAEYLVLLLNSAFGNDKRWVCGRWGLASASLLLHACLLLCLGRWTVTSRGGQMCE